MNEPLMTPAEARATRKRIRTRAAKSELWMWLAVKAQEWADDVSDADNKSRPFAEWPPDEPFVDLARRYQLTPDDLARLIRSVADQLERRAMRAGYADAWV